MQFLAKCKLALSNQVTLSNQNSTRRLFVFTHASDLFWSGIMTQVSVSDIAKTHGSQRHEPLAFHFARFNGSRVG